MAVQAGCHFRRAVCPFSLLQHGADLFLGANAGWPLEALVGENKHREIGSRQIIAQPLDLLVIDETGVSSAMVGWHIVGIQHYPMDPPQIEAVIACGHAVKRHHLLALEPTVRIVIAKHVESLSFKSLEQICEAAVRGFGRAEIPHLQNCISLPQNRLAQKCSKSLGRIVHDVLVHVGDDGDADFVGLTATIGGQGQRKSRRRREGETAA